MAPQYANAITAISNITMNGNNITVDGYDSSDTVHFPNGQYTNTYRMAIGNVASEYGIISVGNANIYGKLLTTPVAAVPVVGASGYVGEWPTVPLPPSHIEDGWYLNDFNMDIPDVQPPSLSSNTLISNNSKQNINGINTIVLGSGDFLCTGSLTIGNKEVLDVMTPSRLWVQGSFNMSGQSAITLEKGATLTMYVGMPSGSATSAQFQTVNYALPCNPSTLMIYGLPSTTGVSFAGNSTYVGTVYAPEASFTLSGSGNNTTDVQGALVVHDINVNGHFNVHYDNNLTRNGLFRGYIANSWHEL